jgi:hypothetical protein
MWFLATLNGIRLKFTPVGINLTPPPVNRDE